MFHHTQPSNTRKTRRSPVSCLTLAAVLLICLMLAAPAAATPEDATEFDGSGGPFASASALAAAINDPNTATASGNTITLHKDINITGTVNLTGSMTILGGGNTIWRGGADFFLINVTSGTLTLGDGTSQLTIHGQDDKYSANNRFSSILVNGSGTKLVMKNGVTLKNSTLMGNTDPYIGRGGAVFVDTGAVFEMQGGLITNNSIGTGDGGGIYNKGTLTMTGGTISGNIATYSYQISGGAHGIYNSGTMTMSGGAISDNIDPGGFGYNPGIRNSGTLTVSGGTISGNGGEGIRNSGTLKISNGTISGNVFYGITNTKSLNISGGTISGNKGGICNSDGSYNIGGYGTLNISGGTISGNKGGINNPSGCTLNISGGTISGNTGGSNEITNSGIYSSGTLMISGSAVVDADNQVYLYYSNNHIIVPAAFTGSVNNITGSSAVLTKGYQLVKMQNGIQASTVLDKFRMGNSSLLLLINATANTLDVDKPMPEVASASIAAYNSTAANVTFTLSDRADTRGAAGGAWVNLTQGTTVISKLLSQNIAKGETVADIQLTGLTQDVSYQLNITPLNITAAGTPRVFTYSNLFTAPVIDRIDIYNGTTKVSGTTVLLRSGATQIYTAKVYNKTLLLKEDPVNWASSGGKVTVTPATGITTTAAAVTSGTETITASVSSSGATSSFTIRVLDSDIPDTLNLTVDQTNLRLGSDVAMFTAVLTNSAGGTQYDNVAVRISDDTGTVMASGVTGRPLVWRPTAPGVHTFTAVVTVSNTEMMSNPVSVTVTVPEGGDGYSSSIPGIIDGNGHASFGIATGITGVSFAKGTTGTVILETKPTGITAPENAHAVADLTPPPFEGSAEIGFSVPLAVLRDQGLDVNDVALHHYVNSKWVKLPTFYVGEDRGAAKYVAQTTSFSPFAIVYEKSGAQTVERSTPQPTKTKDSGSSAVTAKPTATTTSGTASATAVPTTSAATGGATAVPTMTQAPVPVAGVLLGLLAACGVLIRRRE